MKKLCLEIHEDDGHPVVTHQITGLSPLEVLGLLYAMINVIEHNLGLDANKTEQRTGGPT